MVILFMIYLFIFIWIKYKGERVVDKEDAASGVFTAMIAISSAILSILVWLAIFAGIWGYCRVTDHYSINLVATPLSPIIVIPDEEDYLVHNKESTMEQNYYTFATTSHSGVIKYYKRVPLSDDDIIYEEHRPHPRLEEKVGVIPNNLFNRLMGIDGIRVESSGYKLFISKEDFVKEGDGVK